MGYADQLHHASLPSELYIMLWKAAAEKDQTQCFYFSQMKSGDADL